MDETQQPLPPIPPQPPHNHKILRIILGVFILLVVAGLFVFKYQVKEKNEVVQVLNQVATTTDEFAGWRMYRNEEYGFELLLPNSWNGLAIEQKGNNFSPALRSYFFCFPTDNKDYPDSNCGSINIYSGQFSLFGISIYSKMGWKEEQETEVGKPVFINENDKYVFAYYLPQDPPLEYINYNVNKILSTFKFTATSTSTDISTWKTYKDDEYGFVVKYPEDWFGLDKNTKDATGLTILQSSDPKDNLHGVGVPSGLWIEFTKESCLNSDVDFVNKFENYGPNISSRVICKNGLKVIENLWNDNQNFKKNKEILNNVLSTFKFIK